MNLKTKKIIISTANKTYMCGQNQKKSLVTHINFRQLVD